MAKEGRIRRVSDASQLFGERPRDVTSRPCLATVWHFVDADSSSTRFPARRWTPSCPVEFISDIAWFDRYDCAIRKYVKRDKERKVSDDNEKERRRQNACEGQRTRRLYNRKCLSSVIKNISVSDWHVAWFERCERHSCRGYNVILA